MFDITPKSKIADIIEAYPELKEIIIDMAPAFQKLQNPFLMKTVARVTSLAQAAKVGNLNVQNFVNTLRQRVGQAPLDINILDQKSDEPPLWFKTGTIVKTIDARLMLEQGEHPVGLVLQEIRHIEGGHILELITPFVPAPLIDKVKEQFFHAWTLQKSAEEFHSYFTPQAQ